MRRDLGLIHVYCGDGKGKTTAAMGLAVRAAGWGMQVVICQFLKDGTSKELDVLRTMPNVKIMTDHVINKFSFRMNEEEKKRCKDGNDALFEKAAQAVQGGTCDLLLLDELIGTLDKNLISGEPVYRFLGMQKSGACSRKKIRETDGAEKHAEIVITGRNPSPELLDLADYVTEMKKIKHPFDAGVGARDGIER